MLKFAKSSYAFFLSFHQYDVHLKICIATKSIKPDTRVIIIITYTSMHVSIRVSGYETGNYNNITSMENQLSLNTRVHFF